MPGVVLDRGLRLWGQIGHGCRLAEPTARSRVCPAYRAAMDEQAPEYVEILRLEQRRDAAEVLYALNLRGVKGLANAATERVLKRRWVVSVPSEHAERVREELPAILDAMLPLRAENGRGGCYACDYSLLGTSKFSEKCPECGADLMTLEARFRCREPR